MTSGTPPGQARASTSKPTSVPRKPLPLAASLQTTDPNLQGETSLDLSTEDTEMIGLGAEDSANSENIDPNVQAEKKSASLSRPLSSAKSGTYCHYL